MIYNVNLLYIYTNKHIKFIYGSMAQSVAHWSNKPTVMGSSPIGTIFVVSACSSDGRAIDCSFL